MLVFDEAFKEANAAFRTGPIYILLESERPQRFHLPKLYTRQLDVSTEKAFCCWPTRALGCECSYCFCKYFPCAGG